MAICRTLLKSSRLFQETETKRLWNDDWGIKEKWSYKLSRSYTILHRFNFQLSAATLICKWSHEIADIDLIVFRQMRCILLTPLISPGWQETILCTKYHIFVVFDYHSSNSPKRRISWSGIEKYNFCLQKLKTEASLGGIMLWDVSMDQNNIIDGSRYSDHVFTLLKDTSIVRPNTKTPTQAPIQAATTSPDQETSQGTVEKERE